MATTVILDFVLRHNSVTNEDFLIQLQELVIRISKLIFCDGRYMTVMLNLVLQHNLAAD